MSLINLKKLKQLPKAKPGEINYDFFDRFTIAHFLIGVAYAWLVFGFGLCLFLAVAWELIENLFKAYVPLLFPNASADTLRNSIGDIIAVCCGWAFLHYYL